MNRLEEYQQMLVELDSTPEPLGSAVERAMQRKNAVQKKRRVFHISAGSFAACFLGFVLLVNLSPPFAKACESIPLLRELAAAVSFSPSLSAAVENDYVQSIGQSQTKNEITATVEYVIVDRKQVSIFFSLESDLTNYLDFWYDIDVPGVEIGYNSYTGSYGRENGELRQIDVNFIEVDVPEVLDFNLKVYDNALAWDHTVMTAPESSVSDDMFAKPEEEKKNYLAEFDFRLEFDPYFTAQGEVIPVDSSFIIDGQTITLTEVEVYPTHLRINLDDASDNTAWLKGLDLYLENEHGERFKSGINGIGASGDPDGEGYATFWLDSPFFSQGEHLTLYITGAQWLEKDQNRVRLDLANKTAEGLSEEVRFLKAEKGNGGWMVSFAAPQEPDGGMYQLFSGHFWDEDGNEYDIMRWSSTMGYWDEKEKETVEWDTMFTDEFPLAGLKDDVAYLEPVFSYTTDLTASPVAISIK